MGDIIVAVIVFAAGLVTGWVFLPEPKFVRDFFVSQGWAKPK